MSIQIKKIKLLSYHDYSKVNILEKDNNYKVTIYSNSNDTTLSNYSNENDLEVIKDFINIFLSTNNISYLKEETNSLVALGKNELILNSSNNLYQFFPSFLDKFQQDRLKFLEANQDINYYEIKMDNYSKYSLEENCFDEFISIDLKAVNNSLTTREKNFLKHFLYHKFTDLKQEVIIEPKIIRNKKSVWHKGFYASCGDTVIDFNDLALLPTVDDIKEECNKLLNNKKKGKCY